MIETEIKVKYDSIVKAQAEIARLDAELARMQNTGGGSVEEMQRLQDELNSFRDVVGENVSAILGMSQATAGDLSLALDSATAKVTALSDSVDISKTIISGLEEDCSKAKGAIAELTEEQARLEAQFSSDKAELEKWAKLRQDLTDDAEATAYAEQEMARYSARIAEVSPRLREINTALREKTLKMSESNMSLNIERSALSNNEKQLTRSQMALEQTKRKYAELKDSVIQSADAVRESSASFQSLALNLAAKAGLAGGFGMLINNIISTRQNFQNMEVAMSTMLGKDKASGIMADLKQLATQSPLAMTDMVGAEKMMVSFGLDAKKSVEYIKALSDISGGDSGKFNSLALAFSQMSSTGKLMGQDLMQMVNQGFNPLDEISRKTGKSIGQLKDEMSKGAISAKMVQDAFMSATQEGGKFFGMSEAGSQTISGQLSMLGDAWDNVFNSMGQQMEGVATKVISVTTDLVKNWQDLIPVIIGVATAYGVVKVQEMGALAMDKALAMATKEKISLEQAMNIVREGGTTSIVKQTTAEAMRTAGIKQSTFALGLQAQKQALVNAVTMASPYVLAAGALALLCKAVWDICTAHAAFSEAQGRMNNRLTEAAVETRKSQVELIHAIDAYKDAAAAVGNLASEGQDEAESARSQSEAARGNSAAERERSGAVSETADATARESEATEDNTAKTEDNTEATEDAAKKEKELEKAKNNLVSLADKYGITLTDEQLKVQNLADTYATLKQRIEDVNKVKAYDSIKDESGKNIDAAASISSELAKTFNSKVTGSTLEEQALLDNVNVAGAASIQELFQMLKEGKVILDRGDITTSLTSSSVVSGVISGLTGPLMGVTSALLDAKKTKDYENLMSKISEQAGQELAQNIDNMLQTLGDNSFTGKGGYVTDFVRALEQAVAEAGNLRAVENMETDAQRRIAEEAAAQAQQAVDAAAEQKYSLSEIVQRIREADKKIKEVRQKMQSGKFSDNDKKELEEAQSKMDTATKEYKQVTGKDWGATKDSAKKLKEAELKLEGDLFNLRRQEENIEKEALSHQLNKEESLIKQKDLQDKILEIERRQAIEDLKRQEADKLRQIKERKDLTSADRDKLLKATTELYEGKTNTDGTHTGGLIDAKEREFGLKAAVANAEFIKKQEEQLKELLGTYGDYYDKRKAIEERYAKERKKLEESGVSEDSAEWNNLERSNEKALVDLGKSYNYDENEWKEAMKVEKYINDIAEKAVVDGTDAMLVAVSMAIAEMESELTTLDEQIEQAKLSGDSAKAMELDSKRLNMQKQINKSREVERSLQQDAEQHNGRSSKELEQQNKRYEKTKKVIGLVKTAFEELGDVVGEDTKKYMEMVTVIADSTLSVIGSIQGFTEAVNEGMTESGKKSAESVKAVEKASVILAVIGAVIQVATKIMQMFGKGNQTADEVARLREMASIYSEIAEAQADIAANARTADEAAKATDRQTEALRKQAEAKKEAIRERAASRSFNARSIGYRTNDKLQGSGWQSAFNAAGVSVRNWEELMNLAPEKLREIRENNAFLWSGLDSDIRQSLESLISIDEQGKQAADDLQDRFANITLDSLKDSANEVFKDVSAQADEFSESVKSAIAESVINQAVEEQFGDRIKAYQEKLAEYGKGGYSPEEARELMEEGRQIERDINESKARKAEEYGESGLFGSKDDNTVTTGTFAEMSEATANALEARFTAVYESNLRIEGAVTTNGGILGSLAEINSSIAEQIASGARAQAEAQTETQRILAESLLELRDIRANGTGILQLVRTMASDLAEVKNSTAKL